MFMVVNKAPANLVDPSTGDVQAVFPETGVYFLYASQGEMTAYVSSLSLPAKSEIIPIPGELTNIVGGYVGKERKDPLIDAVVPASSFELDTTSSETYYEAPITLGFTPADGDLIRGTINGVEVNGSWIGRSKYANLYRVGNRDVPFCVIGFRSEKAVISLQQDSTPTTDYELHLYRYVPADIVQIPQEYVEGLEETKNTADAAESLHYTLEEKSYAGVYDKKTEGRDTFKCNGFDYYKISDFVATYVEIKRFSGTYNDGTETSELFAGKNCVVCGGFIVVNASGQCSYTNEFGTFEFTSPSAGLYALYVGDTHPSTARSYNFTFNIIAPIVTNLNTYKKYYITVDDNGTLKATEIT